MNQLVLNRDAIVGFSDVTSSYPLYQMKHDVIKIYKGEMALGKEGYRVTVDQYNEKLPNGSTTIEMWRVNFTKLGCRGKKFAFKMYPSAPVRVFIDDVTGDIWTSDGKTRCRRWTAPKVMIQEANIHE